MSKFHPSRYRANESSLKVVKYKLQGMTNQQIAKILGVTPRRVIHLYNRAFKALKYEMETATKDLLQIELARLDMMMMRLWHDTIEDENFNAAPKERRARNIEVLLKIMERRSKLLGLDAPEKRVDVSVGVNLNELGVDELRAELEKMGFSPGNDMPSLDYKLPGEVVIDSPLTAEEAEKMLKDE
jgi:hypothetical protein